MISRVWSQQGAPESVSHQLQCIGASEGLDSRSAPGQYLCSKVGSSSQGPLSLDGSLGKWQRERSVD